MSTESADVEPQFLSAAFDTVQDVVTNLLPKASDGVPAWVLLIIVVLLFGKEALKWWNNRGKKAAEPKEVKPELPAPPETLPVAVQLATRDTVNEILHEVRHLLQSNSALGSRLGKIERDLGVLVNRKR